MVNLTRNLNNWETNEYMNLMQLLFAHAGPSETLDEPIWKISAGGALSVNSYYAFLMGNGRQDEDFP